jgi:hypothetical protein
MAEEVRTETLARGLGRSVLVEHPTFNGRRQTWSVRIDTIARRTTRDTESGGVVEIVSFRGPAQTEDGWSGTKTFLVPQCLSLVDLSTGERVLDVASWLVKVAAGK